MDTKIVRYILCRMLGVEAALLLVPVLVAVIYQEKCGIGINRSISEYLQHTYQYHKHCQLPVILLKQPFPDLKIKQIGYRYENQR